MGQHGRPLYSAAMGTTEEDCVIFRSIANRKIRKA